MNGLRDTATPARTTGESEDWTTNARCRGLTPAEFFPEESLGVDHAASICSDCPVRAECLNYALDHHIKHGIWGGTSQRERQRILRRRQHLRPAPKG